jgi:hypothetical protein
MESPSKSSYAFGIRANISILSRSYKNSLRAAAVNAAYVALISGVAFCEGSRQIEKHQLAIADRFDG